MQVEDRLAQLPPLKETVRQYGLAADKRLGQHFLFDLNITHKIMRLAVDVSQTTVFEVGPGPGGLTRAILAAGPKALHVVEKDERAIPIQAELQSASMTPMEIHHADALTCPLWAMGDAPRQIIANLPYNVGTLMLLNWLEHAPAFDRMILMFQKEVADRLLAKPDSQDYGRLSVITQFHCKVERGMNLPASAFVPPPKVASAVVVLRPYQPRPFEADPKRLSQVTAAAFGQRRKMLRASLKSLPVSSEALLAATGIDGARRAETLSVEEFCLLARELDRLIQV